MNIVETSKFNVLPPFRWQMSSPTCTAEALAQVMEYAYKMSNGGEWRRFHSYGIYANPKINKHISSGGGMDIEEALKSMCSNSAFPSDFIDKDETNLGHWSIVDFYKRKFENNPKALALKDEFVLDGYVNMSKNDYARITNIINNKQDCVAPMLLWIYYYPELTQVGISEDLIVPDVKEPDKKPTSTHVVLIIGTATIDGREYYICKDSMWIRESTSIYYMPADWAGIISIHAPIYNKEEFGQPNRSKINATDVDDILFKKGTFRSGMNISHNIAKDIVINSVDVHGDVLVKEVLLDGVGVKDFSVSNYNDDHLTITLNQQTISHNHLSIITDGVGKYSPRHFFSGFVRGAERSGNFMKYKIDGEQVINEIGFTHNEKGKYGNIMTKYPQTTIPMVVGLEDSLKTLELNQGEVMSVNGMKGDVVLGGEDIILSDNWKVPIGTIVQNNYTYKADKTYVDKELGKKADKAYVDKELEEKAYLTYVASELKTKADKDKVVTSVNGEKGDIEIDGVRTSTIVIANYDSHESSKKGADIIIEKGENASIKINEAIKSLEGIGGEVKLMEGNYNVECPIRINIPSIHLNGIPGATVLKQSDAWEKAPQYYGNSHVVDTHDLKDGGIVNISNLIIEGANIKRIGGFNCLGSSFVTNCSSNNTGGRGFDCYGSSRVTNCTSTNNGIVGFNCMESSQVTNCTSNNDKTGFFSNMDSQLTNCTSNNPKEYGFHCTGLSQLMCCTSNNSEGIGFNCNGANEWDNSRALVQNCVSKKSAGDGIYCSNSFYGVCAFNTLKGDKLNDESPSFSKVEYNIEQ